MEIKKYNFGDNPVQGRYNTEPVFVDWKTAKLSSYDNSTNTAIYNVKEQNEHFWSDVYVSKRIDDIDERLKTTINPVRFFYAVAVGFNSTKNDPDGKIYEQLRQEVIDNPQLFFTKNGNWRKRGLPAKYKSPQKFLNVATKNW